MEHTTEQEQSGQDKPFWVILNSLEHFMSGHVTLAEAEAEARRLNQEARAQGRPPHYVATPRRQSVD
jgi:hypothetical protein